MTNYLKHCVQICFVATLISGCKKHVDADYVLTNQTPVKGLSDEALMDTVQRQTFRYFWNYAEPNSGLARERWFSNGKFPENDENVVATGGSGFGLMAILTGIKREYVTRQDAFERFRKIASFLEKAERFHGAWPHWMDGKSGRVVPFGQKDDGGDLVETAFLCEGLICVREYYKNGTPEEKQLAARYDQLWRDVDFNWYTNKQKKLFWHWSPKYNWEMNFPLEGYNETLITYILASGSPGHSIDKTVYDACWARSGNIVSTNKKYGFPLLLKHNFAEEFGGPLFWAHYTWCAVNPNGLKDNYADYWKVNYNHVRIDYEYCVRNPGKFKCYGHDYWGLTASYSINGEGTIGYDSKGRVGYSAHSPANDLGVVSPTAAISSIVYLPKESLSAMRNFYENLNKELWGKAGFYDAHSCEHQATSGQYLAIDQGPIVVMIENYRSGMLWDLFMNAPEIKSGLTRLGFTSARYDLVTKK